MNKEAMEKKLGITGLGIIGGGQLARMLCEAAHRLGFRPVVLAAGSDDPAAQICRDAIFGGAGDPVALKRFLSEVELVAFENEFVSCGFIESIAASLKGHPAPVFLPSLETISELQDKIRQKRVLGRLGIASAPHEVFAEKQADPVQWSRAAARKFESGCVLKWSRLGYDGKGTLILPPAEVSAPGAADRIRAFFGEAAKKGVDVFAEKRIAFRRELSIVSCFSRTGEFAAYPLVVSRQESGICRLVTGPAAELGVSSELERQAQDFARRLARAMNLHGTFALELFETESGELLVNEIAPRVHNTGHFTLDCAPTSQFENHWRALLGMPLGQTGVSGPFAMLNLLGPAGCAPGPVRRLPVPSASVRLHWYGKSEIRAGRKMGHLNACGAPVSELVQRLEACEKEWIQSRQA